MGWRERDWAKFTEKEWKAYAGSSAGGSGSRMPRRAVGWGALACGAVIVAILFWPQVKREVNRLSRASAGSVSRAPGLAISPVLPIPAPSPPASHENNKLVRIHWRTSDLAQAAQAGRICLTDRRHGRICASYVVGERPADTLTRRIESLGLDVQSSG